MDPSAAGPRLGEGIDQLTDTDPGDGDGEPGGTHHHAFGDRKPLPDRLLVARDLDLARATAGHVISDNPERADQHRGDDVARNDPNHVFPKSGLEYRREARL